MEDRLQAAIAIVRAEYPEARLFQIGIPGDEEIYLARKCAWNEYKQLIGAVKDEVTANEILVQKFLVHPKLSYADRPGDGPRQGRDTGPADSEGTRLRHRRGEPKKRLSRARREVCKRRLKSEAVYRIAAFG